MFRLSSVSGAALAALCAASVFATTVAAEDQTTDIGTLDRETADKAFPAKPPYSPYAGRNFPTRPFFGDTHTHVQTPIAAHVSPLASMLLAYSLRALSSCA